MENLTTTIINEFSSEKASKHMEYLVNQVGERLSGTKKIEKAANYIFDELHAYGLDCCIDEFPMYHSFPIKASLSITSPAEEQIPAEPVCHIKSTGNKGISGELLYLGVGGEQDYKGQDAVGKIVLTDMNWAPARPEKARIAYEKGAAALIIMNWGLPDPNNPAIQMGAVKSQWGNPTPDAMEEIPDIPVISISRYHGEKIKELSREAQVSVWLEAEATREWVTAKQPTAYLRCSEETDECIIFGSHLDAWGKSAICNATGNALLMELARCFYKHKDAIKRNIWFVFWDGHEIAEGGGSTYFVDKHWQELTKNAIAYVNADNLAIEETTVPTIEGNSELQRFSQHLLEQVWGEKGHWITAYKGGGDSSFFGIGIPYLSFNTEYTEEKLKELNYAVYGPWLHTEHDTIDKIDPKLYRRTTEFFTHLMVALLNKEVIPYSLSDFLDEIKRNLTTLTEHYPDYMSSDLGGLNNALHQLVDKVNSLEEQTAQPNPPQNINLVLMKTLRILYPVFRCYSGRYGQDACGSAKTEKPVPRLAAVLEEISGREKDSHQYLLWETQLMREKNRVFDSLHDACTLIDCFLSRLS